MVVIKALGVVAAALAMAWLWMKAIDIVAEGIMAFLARSAESEIERHQAERDDGE